MTANFREALQTLCEELEVPVPSQDSPAIEVDGQTLKFQSLPRGEVVMVSSLGSINDLAADRQESVTNLVSRCMNLHAARFAKLGISSTITLEDGELVLWEKFHSDSVSIRDFLYSAESMLNEAEYWNSWLTAA